METESTATGGGTGHAGGGGARDGGQGFFHRPRLPYYQKTQVYKHHHYLNRQSDGGGPSNATNFDGKRMRKNVNRKTVDYNSSVVRLLESRVWQRDPRDARWIQPDMSYLHEMGLPCSLKHNPINAVTTKFIRTSTNKVRCPIFCAVWTPEGRRLVTGASSGEFTLWNGLTFNFETILQAHDYPVRTMTWSHNDLWLLTADHLGYVKYWQSNMNNVKMYQAHKDNPIRGARYDQTQHVPVAAFVFKFDAQHSGVLQYQGNFLLVQSVLFSGFMLWCIYNTQAHCDKGKSKLRLNLLKYDEKINLITVKIGRLSWTQISHCDKLMVQRFLLNLYFIKHCLPDIFSEQKPQHNSIIYIHTKMFVFWETIFVSIIFTSK